MYEYICEWCGKICYAKYKSTAKRFCSHKCANEASWAKRDISQYYTKFTCTVCGKEFYVKNGDHRIKAGTIKYCSKTCMGVANRKPEGKKKRVYKPRDKTIVYGTCPICGRDVHSYGARCCSRECAGAYAKKHNSHHAYYENGYLVEYKPGYNKRGNAKQHRLIAEEMIGRPLRDDEVVHHVNGNRSDNRPENLMVMTRGEHSVLHRRKEIEEGKPLFGRQ